ncbi:hypothetical protein C8Q75DRAFT_747285 [Abortiporus biennis]|nr:hypothetical protein C8Q75DRAFT_747285 [Abortiporus biennis]
MFYANANLCEAPSRRLSPRGRVCCHFKDRQVSSFRCRTALRCCTPGVVMCGGFLVLPILVKDECRRVGLVYGHQKQYVVFGIMMIFAFIALCDLRALDRFETSELFRKIWTNL